MEIIPQNEQQDTLLLRSALAYAHHLHFPVFPIVPGTKRPLTTHGLNDATTDNEQIRAWWSQNPDAGIGIPCGPVSGLLIIDEDLRNGSEESIDRLEHADFEPLPETVTVLTPTGGKHRYFQHDERVTCSKLDEYPGIDLQGKGRYIIAPPSAHPNGGTYEFELSSHISDTPIARLSDWFIRLAQHSESGKIKARTDEYWLNILKGIDDGGRNNAAASLIGHLLRKNVAVPVVYELIQAWNERNEPPIESEELTKTFNSVLKAEVQRVRNRRNK